MRPSGLCATPAAQDLVRGHPVDRLAVEQHLAGHRPQQPRDRAQGGGLARPVAADQADDLALLDVERDAAHGLDRAVGDDEVADLRGSSRLVLFAVRAPGRLVRRGDSGAAPRPPPAGPRGRPRPPAGRRAPRPALPSTSSSPCTSTSTRSQRVKMNLVSCSMTTTETRGRGSAKISCRVRLGLLRVHARRSARRAGAPTGPSPARGRSPAAAGRRRAGCGPARRRTGRARRSPAAPRCARAPRPRCAR